MCEKIDLKNEQLWESYKNCFPLDVGNNNVDDDMSSQFDCYLETAKVYAYKVLGQTYWFSIRPLCECECQGECECKCEKTCKCEEKWLLQDVCKIPQPSDSDPESDPPKAKRLKTETMGQPSLIPSFANAFSCAQKDLDEKVKANLYLVTDKTWLVAIYETCGFKKTEKVECLDVGEDETAMKLCYPKTEGGGARNAATFTLLFFVTILGGVFGRPLYR